MEGHRAALDKHAGRRERSHSTSRVRPGDRRGGYLAGTIRINAQGGLVCRLAGWLPRDELT